MKKLLLLVSLIAAALAVGNAEAQTNFQYPTTPWQAYAPARIQCGLLLKANFNVTTDQAIPISMPAGYMVDSITASGPSVSMTTAQGGLYTAASKGGVNLVASSQAYTALTTSASGTTGNALLLTLTTAANTTAFGGFGSATPLQTIYLSLTVAQGAAATANIRVYCRPLYG